MNSFYEYEDKSLNIQDNMLVKYTDEGSVFEVVISNGVTSIQGAEFRCAATMESIVIPASVRNIGEQAFIIGCENLKSITVSKDNKYFCSYDGVLYNKDMTVLIAYPKRKCTEFTVPDGVQRIGNCAFYNCTELKRITFPDSLIAIDDFAFSYCYSLERLNISKNIKFIGDSAFYRCIELKEIKISENTEFIDGYAFANCDNIKRVTVPYSVKYIGRAAFCGCLALKSIEIPDTVSVADNVLVYNNYENEVILYKNNIKVSFRDILSKKQNISLMNFLKANTEERYYCFNGMEEYYKTPLALFMSSAYPSEIYYINYLKNNTEEAVRYLIDTENVELLYKFFEFGFVTDKNIDSFISYAVEHTKNGGNAEAQLVLSKYKRDNFSSKSIDTFDKFML